jgi:hypothetical protein
MSLVVHSYQVFSLALPLLFPLNFLVAHKRFIFNTKILASGEKFQHAYTSSRDMLEQYASAADTVALVIANCSVII